MAQASNPWLLALQNASQERLGEINLQRSLLKEDLEKQALQTDAVLLQKSQISHQIALEDLRGEQLQLHSLRIQNDLSTVGLGKLSDQLGYEQLDRLLTQKQQSANLELKAIQVGALFEQVRHERTINGSPVAIPRVRGR